MPHPARNGCPTFGAFFVFAPKVGNLNYQAPPTYLVVTLSAQIKKLSSRAKRVRGPVIAERSWGKRSRGTCICFSAPRPGTKMGAPSLRCLCFCRKGGKPQPPTHRERTENRRLIAESSPRTDRKPRLCRINPIRPKSLSLQAGPTHRDLEYVTSALPVTHPEPDQQAPHLNGSRTRD